MTEFLRLLVQGIPIGCVYALMAVGLVLTYRTSGVFNLAYGAQAFASAVVFYELRVAHHWSVAPAAAVAILVVGPLLGLVLDRVIFRFLRTAAPLTKTVTSLGLLIAIPALVEVFVGESPLQNPPGLSPGVVGVSVPVYHFGSFYWDQNQVITIAATAIVALGLTALFRWSSLGLQMRAVVESPRMAELSGVNADRVASFSWLLSGMIAGLTGVLFAPLFPSLVAGNYFSLLVAAIAACVFARLSSIPLALLGGLALGALEQIVSGYLPHNSVLFTGLRPSLPFVVLVLLLLFWPGLRKRREATDPLASVDPPPEPPGASIRPQWVTIATRVTGVLAIIALVLLPLTVFNSFWLLLFTEGVISAVIFLSITVVTGMGGQISLCQATFAAVGAFTVGQLVSNFNLPVLVALLAGMAFAGLVGAVIALPALRLEGIYVALATLAFALLFDNVLVPLNWVGGGYVPKSVPRPVIGTIDFGNDHAFYVLCLVVLGLVGGAVWLLREGTTGKFLDATRTSERAAASVGIDLTKAKITAFAISGAVAGLGGGLLASATHAATPANYAYLLGLFWVLIVVTIGSRTVAGAIIGGVTLTVLPQLLTEIGVGNELLWTEVIFGLGVITYAKFPEGSFEVGVRGSANLINRLMGREPMPATAAGEPPDLGGGDAGGGAGVPVAPVASSPGTDMGQSSEVSSAPGFPRSSPP